MMMNLFSKVLYPLQATCAHACLTDNDSLIFLVPPLPQSRAGNLRQRGDETPSHPGGLSEIGRKRLEDYRRSRDKPKGPL